MMPYQMLAALVSAAFASALLAGEAERPASEIRQEAAQAGVRQPGDRKEVAPVAEKTSSPVPVQQPAVRIEERAVFVDGRVQTVKVAVPIVPRNQIVPVQKADPNNPVRPINPAALPVVPANVFPQRNLNRRGFVRGRIIQDQQPTLQTPRKNDNEPIEAPRPPASAEEVRTWIEQLQDRDYATRHRAMLRLVGEGERAVAAVAKAADCDELERSSRCLEILRRLAMSGDASTVQSSRDALRTLAKSQRRFVAHRVSTILPMVDPPPQVARNNRFGNIAIAGGRVNLQVQVAPAPVLKREVKFEEKGKKYHVVEKVEAGKRSIVVTRTEKDAAGKEKVTETKYASSIAIRRQDPDLYELYRKHIRQVGFQRVLPQAAQPNIQIQAINGNNIRVQAINGNNVQIQATEVNGQRKVEVTENGRQISISEKQGKEIKIEVREKGPGGKEVTRKYEAADLADLKKKHPDAAKLYEKYGQAGAGNNGAIQIINGGIQINGIGPPGIALPVVPMQALPRRIIRGQVLPGQIIPAGVIPQPPMVPQRIDPQTHKSIQQAKERLAAAEARLRKLGGEKDLKPADLQPVLREIEQARQVLESAEKNGLPTPINLPQPR